MSAPNTPSLLVYLAEANWFAGRAETVCTQALAHLLGDPDADAALRALLAERSGVPLPEVLQWQPEFITADGGRVDIAGFQGEAPLVIIEGKLDHTLDAGQLRSYAAAQRQRLAGAPGVLAVLVPAGRVAEAWEVLGKIDLDAQRAGSAVNLSGSPPIAATVVSFDEVLDQIAAKGPADSPAMHEVELLRDLVGYYAALDVAPFTDKDLGEGWKARADDWEKIARRTCSQLGHHYGIRPMHAGPDGPYRWRRYLASSPQSRSLGPNFAVGVRDPLPGHRTPVWLRWHRDTPCFADVQRNLQAAGTGVVEVDGHLWFPLTPLLDHSGLVVVEQIAAAVRDHVATAEG